MPFVIETYGHFGNAGVVFLKKLATDVIGIHQESEKQVAFLLRSWFRKLSVCMMVQQCNSMRCSMRRSQGMRLSVEEALAIAHPYAVEAS